MIWPSVRLNECLDLRTAIEPLFPRGGFDTMPDTRIWALQERFRQGCPISRTCKSSRSIRVLPISGSPLGTCLAKKARAAVAGACTGALAMNTGAGRRRRSEEHTSELQSRGHLVCRLLLEKKKEEKK